MSDTLHWQLPDLTTFLLGTVFAFFDAGIPGRHGLLFDVASACCARGESY